MRRFVAVLAMLSLLPLLAAAAVPEPDDYRRAEYRAPTPATLQGAEVISTGEAAALWKAGSALFIDVMPRAPRPANLPQGTLWHPARRDAIPGSVWLVDTGYGDLAAEAETYFRESLQMLSKGDAAAPLVFYCQRNCWMSWNAARRAVALGYSGVSWFPEGTDGWGEAGLPLQPHEPLALP